MQTTPFHIDLKAFGADIDQLRKELRNNIGAKDLAHFKNIERIVWLLAAIGLLTAGFGLNLVSITALAAASFARWAIISHHISHKAYEKIPGAPKRYNSKFYARGWRRVVHWMDWMTPNAWHYEHDILHHYSLGEQADPDVPQNKVEWIRDSAMPMFLRYLFVLGAAMLWKPFYYAINTLNALLNKQEKTQIELGSWALWSPLNKRFWVVMWQCWLPYISFRFVFLPSLFLLHSPGAATSALLNLLVAELVINVWTYVVITPNHAGSDLYVFDQHPPDRASFYLHQIVGSADYNCGGHVRDFMQGYLNYQIEHHLFPDLTLLQYQLAHSRVREICAKHAVPVVEESIAKRLVKLVNILTCKEHQPLWPGVVQPKEQAA